jgi:hypothetical protein
MSRCFAFYEKVRSWKCAIQCCEHSENFLESSLRRRLKVNIHGIFCENLIRVRTSLNFPSFCSSFPAPWIALVTLAQGHWLFF